MCPALHLWPDVPLEATLSPCLTLFSIPKCTGRGGGAGLITCRVSSRWPYFSEIRVSESKPSVSTFSPSPTSTCWPGLVTSTGFQTKERKLSPILGEGSGALNWEVKPGGKARFTCLWAKLTRSRDSPGAITQVSWDLGTGFLIEDTHSLSEPQFAHVSNGDSNAFRTGWRGMENAQHYLTW